MRRTKAEAEATREGILDAAERAFFTHGVARTTLEQIACKAGVTRGAIYWHFADKVEIFNALHERIRLPQEDIIENAVVEDHPDPLGMLEATIIDALTLIAADEQRQRVYTILMCRCEYVGEMRQALERQQDANRRMRANFVRAFERARDKKLLSPAWSPDLAAKSFEAMLTGLFFDWLRFDRNFDLVETGTRCLRKLFYAFRGEDEAVPLT